MLCISGFVDDVMIYIIDSMARQCILKRRKDSLTAKTVASIPTKFCLMMMTKQSPWSFCRGRRLLSTICIVTEMNISQVTLGSLNPVATHNFLSFWMSLSVVLCGRWPLCLLKCSFVRFIRGGGWLLAVFRRAVSLPPVLRPRHGPVRNSPLTLRLVLYIYRA